jgi:hypothetical protein
LTLGLINGHGKGRPDWELKAGELDGQRRVTGGYLLMVSAKIGRRENSVRLLCNVN